MKDTSKADGMLIRFPFLDGWMTYGTEQFEAMPKEEAENLLAHLQNLPVLPTNRLYLEEACGAYPKPKPTLPKLNFK